MQRQNGYTVIELLSCLAILSLIIGIWLGPILSEQLGQHRLNSVARVLSNELRNARHLATHEARIYEVRIRHSGYYVMAESRPVWQTVKFVPWPEGVGLHRDYHSQQADFTFAATGLYNPWKNNSVHLLDDAGRRVRLVISSGGRIQIEHR